MSFQLKLENYTIVRRYKVVIRFDTDERTLPISADLMKFSAFAHASYLQPYTHGLGSYKVTTVVIMTSFVKH